MKTKDLLTISLTNGAFWEHAHDALFQLCAERRTTTLYEVHGAQVVVLHNRDLGRMVSTVRIRFDAFDAYAPCIAA